MIAYDELILYDLTRSFAAKMACFKIDNKSAHTSSMQSNKMLSATLFMRNDSSTHTNYDYFQRILNSFIYFYLFV